MEQNKLDDIVTEQEELIQLADRINGIKNQIKEKINSLPDNSKINRMSGVGFTIKYSDLSSLNLTPAFYDFRYQYEKINDMIESISPFAIISRLQKAIEDKYIKIKDLQVKLHPEVIKNIQGLLNT